jgi:hypothetical protein
MIDKSQFKVNERSGEFYASFSVSGRITVQIKAASLEEARKKAEEMAEDEEFAAEIEDVEECNIDHVWKAPPMYLVTRDGLASQVSHLKEGDAPRDPDKHGF